MTDQTATDEHSDPQTPVAPDAQGGLLSFFKDQLGSSLSLRPFDRKNRVIGLALLLALWAVSGFYKVQPSEQGVVLRFGHWIETTGPGLHYHLPYPVEAVLFPKVTAVNQINAKALQMLTGDENIVEADYSVFWKIKDASAYLFHVDNPDALVSTAAETSVREVIGRYPIQAAISDKREEIADAAELELQRLLDGYQSGIQVFQVHLQRVDPPAAVIDAFNDVQRARADQERARNEAEAYRNDILPRARGQAAHIVQEGVAYKAQKLDLAKGQVSAYLSAYTAYKSAPDVVSWQIYMDSMDRLLGKAGKVVIDSSGKSLGNIMPYMQVGAKLPLAAAPVAAPVVTGAQP